ncbi:uncharacterized protein LOC132152030 [Carassius carassius]|uniref:uncharacterized protein LOC132152030 n=1 Tax=Carassius carassius TaxID=217509 RepID=UPI0028688A58|nr:uncharacterized protein LOC132152030 [Carassius carassius]
MVNRCCIVGCKSATHNRKGEKIENGLTFHRFPAWRRDHGEQVSQITKSRRLAWVAAVKRPNITFHSIPMSMRVCSLHFHSGKPAYEMFECHPDWAPSLHLGHTEVKAVNPERYNRRTKRKQGLKQNTAAPATSPDLPDLILEIDDVPLVKEEPLDEDAPPDEDEVSQRLQMDEAAPKDDLVEQKECSFCDCRRAEINRLLEENRLLKEELSKKTISEDFLGDDEKVEYYTGLPCFAVLMGVLTKLLPCLAQTRCKLSPFQMLFLTLMRLRLNLPIQHVAHLFCIDQKTVSTTFRDTIGALFTHLSPLVHWPERHCLKGGILQQFVEIFGNHVAVIVDCFEINTERASKENSIAQTSSQKHTLKYLIGFTPRGATAFVSKGWEGGVSDKDVIESSGLLDKLLPGDFVLVDRGFDTGDVVGLMCAEVENQKLVPKDEVETRKIAHLRVHLKSVIGCVRTKYTMLSEAVPVSMIAPREDDGMIFLDKVVTVCCAFTNMCPSVMKLETMT